ncbi:MAG: chemotaxis protein CheB [Deltaproteobacteria bacterium]|nr:chemotaxis protein CheB [Deltaproteobacteria bacterium]
MPSANLLLTPFEVVAIAASYGGIEAIKVVISTLPADFPVPIVFLLHVGDSFSRHLPLTIGRESRLPVKWAEDGEQMISGRIYVAPPAAHLIIDEAKRCSLVQTPRVQHSRPSANMLFGSIAFAFKEQALAVVLTGYGSDGALGANLIKALGGLVIAQDQQSAMCFEMPCAAIHMAGPDLILPLDKIASALIALTMVPGAAQLFAGSSPHSHLLTGSHFIN